MPPGTAGGGSASGGGDPTTTGRAQDVGNRHLGRIPLLGGTYDFDNDGFRWATENNEITFGVRALQQLDARIYANPNQEFASSGIYNPRTRFYFTGNLTRPISYEFSFQQTYGTTNLLDSYLNYRISDGLDDARNAARSSQARAKTPTEKRVCSPVQQGALCARSRTRRWEAGTPRAVVETLPPHPLPARPMISL
jgi:hypothetical protein